MRRRVVLSLLTTAILAMGSAALQGGKIVKPGSERYGWLVRHRVMQGVLKHHNEERARWGLPPLRLDPDMCLAAQDHAAWMAETGYYMHSGLPWAEIIFTGPLSAREAVDGWIASPAHHSIMLSGTEAGFGYMVRDGQTYWVGVFR